MSDRTPKRRRLDTDVIDIDAATVIDIDNPAPVVQTNGHVPVPVNLGAFARPPGFQANGHVFGYPGPSAGFAMDHPPPAFPFDPPHIKHEVKPPLPPATTSTAIDLTDDTSPPPRPHQPSFDAKKPICIGSIDTQALILYPSPLMERGNNTEELVRTRQVRTDAQGDEWLHVKCKWRARGADGSQENDSIVVLNSE